MERDTIFASVPIIGTPRLMLRGIRASDAEAIFATFSDVETMEYYGDEPHRTLDDSREYIRQIAGWYARREGIRWGIARRGGDEVIGSCGLLRFDEDFTHAETGYELRRAYWRQGIMSEAMRGPLDFGFGAMGLHRVEASTDAANERSQGCCARSASCVRASCASASTGMGASMTSTILDCCATSGSLAPSGIVHKVDLIYQQFGGYTLSRWGRGIPSAAAGEAAGEATASRRGA